MADRGGVMREIKFRAWHEPSKQMFYNFLFNNYPEDQFGNKCPHCYTENGGDLKDIYIGDHYGE